MRVVGAVGVGGGGEVEVRGGKGATGEGAKRWT